MDHVNLGRIRHIFLRAGSDRHLSSLSSAHLNAVRGLAAIAVFLGHWRPFWWPQYSAGTMSVSARIGYFLTGFPHEAVIVFFVLSGFLVGGSVLRSIEKWKWRDYLITRLSRLWTVLIPTLVIGATLDFLGGHLLASPIYQGHSTVIYWDVSARLNAGTFACNVLFLQTIACDTLGSNGALWSLANEFWYYLIFPMLILGLLGTHRGPIRLAYLASAVACLVFVGSSIALLFMIWVMGAAITLLPRPLLPKWQSIGLRVCFVGIALGGALFSRLSKGLIADFTLGVAFSGFVWALACAEGEAPRLYAKISGFISDMSYTLYLVHLPALAFIAAYLMQTKLTNGQMGLISAGAVYLYSYLLFFMFEKRTPQVRAWVRRVLVRSSSRTNMPQS